MERTRRAWLRGAVTVGVAGTLAAISFIAPVGAVKESKEASKKFVKSQFAAATSQITSQVDALKAQLGATNASNDGPTALATAQTTLVSLSLTAGRYAVFAKTSVTATTGDPDVNCELKIEGVVRDTSIGEVIATDAQDGTIPLQAVHTLAAPGTAELSCLKESGDAEAKFAKITAIEVPV